MLMLMLLLLLLLMLVLMLPCWLNVDDDGQQQWLVLACPLSTQTQVGMAGGVTAKGLGAMSLDSFLYLIE